MTEPLAVVKTCPHVMSAADAERVLPFWGALSSRGPSIHWLTTPEPLRCVPCNGKGWAWDQSEQIDCPDCLGTGLPGVRIVSHGSVGSGKWPTRERTTEHGVVSVDAAVPIVTFAAYRGRWGVRWRGGPFIFVRDDRAFFYINTASIKEITAEFGGQDFSPGLLAHRIQPRETA